MRQLKYGLKSIVGRILLLVGIGMLCTGSFAQTSRATLSGTVLDPSGAKVEKAQVVITNVDTGTVRTLVTNNSGLYTAASMIPGNYTVKVTAKGFSAEVRSGVVLTVGEAALINFTLQLGNIYQEVEVTENPASVDVTTSELSDGVSGSSMRQLPLNGRSWTDLAALNPGVTTISTQAPVSAPDRVKRGLGGELSISGGRPQANSYLLDGININDYSNAGPGSVLGGNLGVDALQEFTVVTTNPTAQYGRTASGVISAVTRSGTNKLHGSAYEFYRNAGMDARDYFNFVANGPKNSFTRNQYGGSFGGPIQKNKTFFFADYEGVRQNLTTSALETVPSLSARAGNLCQPSADGTNPCASIIQVTPDPAVASFISVFYPNPNATLPGATQDVGGFSLPLAQVTSENYVIAKIDRTFSANDSLAGVYMYDASPTQQPDEFNNVQIFSKTIRQLVSILETHVFSPQTVNTVHIGYSRDNAGSPYSATAVNPAAGTTQYGFQPGDSPGIINVPGLTAFTGGVSAANPILFRWNSFQGYDDVSHTAGINTFVLGGAFERIEDNQIDADFPGGQYYFPTLQSFITNGYNSPANQPTTYITTLPTVLTPRNLRQNIGAVYVQDDLRLKPNLTLNLGLRYEISSVPYEINGRFSNLRVLQGDTPYLGNPYIKNPTFGDVEPRVGLAWDPFRDGKMSIRSAFGIYDNLPYIVEMGTGLDGAYPFAQDVSTNNVPAGSFPGGVYNLVANSPGSRNFYVLQYDPPRNYNLMWNLNVQRSLTNHATLLVGYVGSRGAHNWYQTDDANIVLPTYHDVAKNEYYWPTPIGSGTVIDPLVGQTLDARWNGNSFYDGLETQFTEAMSHGLEGEVSYTWSRCIDTSSGTAASDQYRNSLNVDLYTAPSTHRGPCDTNIGQSLVMNGTWTIPPNKALHGIKSILVNGWQLGGIYNKATGAPFSVTIGGDPLGTNAAVPFDFPDRLKGNGCGKNLTTGNPFADINLKCFAFPNPVNRMGNAGRNELTGPGTNSFTFSAYKNVPAHWISEDASIQLRMEVYNLFNHPNFDAPTNNFQIFDGQGNAVPNAGLVNQTTISNRQIQLAAKMTF